MLCGLEYIIFLKWFCKFIVILHLKNTHLRVSVLSTNSQTDVLGVANRVPCTITVTLCGTASQTTKTLKQVIYFHHYIKHYTSSTTDITAWELIFNDRFHVINGSAGTPEW